MSAAPGRLEEAASPVSLRPQPVSLRNRALLALLLTAVTLGGAAWSLERIRRLWQAGGTEAAPAPSGGRRFPIVPSRAESPPASSVVLPPTMSAGTELPAGLPPLPGATALAIQGGVPAAGTDLPLGPRREVDPLVVYPGEGAAPRSPEVAAPQDRTLPAGQTIDCTLITHLDSTLPGMTTCVVTRHVRSADGSQVLIARGAFLTGHYRSDMRLGQRRIAVQWDNIRTPSGHNIVLGAPATDPLGGAGVPGDVDEHWGQRIGAAFLLSLVQDAIAYPTLPRANGSAPTVVYGNTSATGNSVVAEVLGQSLNMAPTLSREPGARLTVLVAHDLVFDEVDADAS